LDDWEKNYFPMPIEVSGKDDVYVGRIRYDYEDQEKKNGKSFRRRRSIAKRSSLKRCPNSRIIVGNILPM
jgi:hypothetical protein